MDHNTEEDTLLDDDTDIVEYMLDNENEEALLADELEDDIAAEENASTNNERLSATVASVTTKKTSLSSSIPHMFSFSGGDEDILDFEEDVEEIVEVRNVSEDEELVEPKENDTAYVQPPSDLQPTSAVSEEIVSVGNEETQEVVTNTEVFQPDILSSSTILPKEESSISTNVEEIAMEGGTDVHLNRDEISDQTEAESQMTEYLGDANDENREEDNRDSYRSEHVTIISSVDSTSEQEGLINETLPVEETVVSEGIEDNVGTVQVTEPEDEEISEPRPLSVIIHDRTERIVTKRRVISLIPGQGPETHMCEDYLIQPSAEGDWRSQQVTVGQQHYEQVHPTPQFHLPPPQVQVPPPQNVIPMYSHPPIVQWPPQQRPHMVQMHVPPRFSLPVQFRPNIPPPQPQFQQRFSPPARPGGQPMLVQPQLQRQPPPRQQLPALPAPNVSTVPLRNRIPAPLTKVAFPQAASARPPVVFAATSPPRHVIQQPVFPNAVPAVYRPPPPPPPPSTVVQSQPVARANVTAVSTQQYLHYQQPNVQYTQSAQQFYPTVQPPYQSMGDYSSYNQQPVFNSQPQDNVPNITTSLIDMIASVNRELDQCIKKSDVRGSSITDRRYREDSPRRRSEERERSSRKRPLSPKERERDREREKESPPKRSKYDTTVVKKSTEIPPQMRKPAANVAAVINGLPIGLSARPQEFLRRDVPIHMKVYPRRLVVEDASSIPLAAAQKGVMIKGNTNVEVDKVRQLAATISGSSCKISVGRRFGTYKPRPLEDDTIGRLDDVKWREKDKQIKRLVISMDELGRVVNVIEKQRPCKVIVKNIASGTVQNQISKAAFSCGVVKKMTWRAISSSKNEAEIVFSSIEEANAFCEKYNKKMIDLSMISVSKVLQE